MCLACHELESVMAIITILIAIMIMFIDQLIIIYYIVMIVIT